MFPYQQLEVYKKAYYANQKVYRLLKENKGIVSYIRNQLGRASLSIMLNIAEGSGKFTVNDRKNFFAIARGSVFECSSIASFLFDENEISENLKNELYSNYDEVSRMLYAMIINLGKKINTPRTLLLCCLNAVTPLSIVFK